MQELIYFSFADLMTLVEYHEKTNALRYATHRKMTTSERVIIEQYLLATFSGKTEYYERQPALFVYLGTDKRLTKALGNYHSKNNLPQLDAKEVEDSVAALINQSMQRYYFEQIGDTILAARREMNKGRADQRRHRKVKLAELIKAYNVHSDQKITMAEIIPSELKSYFGVEREEGYSRKEHALYEAEFAWTGKK